MVGKCIALAFFLVVAAATAAHGWPGCEQDQIWAVVDGDAVTVYHQAAAYNCCMDGIAYDVREGAGTLEIRATEIATNPCACLCCYNLSVRVEDLAPGAWTLVYVWDDSDTGDTEQWTTEILVGGAAAGPAYIASTWRSGCLDGLAIPEPGLRLGAWGRVKALYR
jgi:hypothetical protein